MHIVAVGLTHRTAPVEIREQFALADEELKVVLDTLRSETAVHEAVVLSTCNRTEAYIAASAFHAGAAAIKATLAGLRPALAHSLTDWLEEYVQLEAVRHLFRVCSGLDSQILGETEILGQVREAYRLASAHGATGTYLDSLFQQALATGKRVHTETSLSRVPVSIGSAAVTLAERRLGGLAGRTVLLVGAGEIAQLAARHVQAAGTGRMLVANRTLTRADAVAQQFAGEAVQWAGLATALAEADVVISGTGARKPVLTAALVGQAAARRGGRPLLIIDIAVPRDVEPAAATLPDVYLYDIDDLQVVVQAGQREREAEAEQAEAIVAAEVDRFAAWLKERAVAPIIKCLYKKAEEMRQHELRRLFNRLPDLTPRQRELITQMTGSLIGKMLSDPTMRLKEFAAESEGQWYAEAVSRLFNLDLQLQWHGEETDD